jgi:hypothetical protein
VLGELKSKLKLELRTVLGITGNLQEFALQRLSGNSTLAIFVRKFRI